MDLTHDPSPPTMPAGRSKRRASRTQPPDGPSAPAESSSKRRRTGNSFRKAEEANAESNNSIEGFDLTNVDDDTDLAKVLQNQQETAIKAQREELGDKPTRFSGLQCIICLETMKDVTATHCGECPDTADPEFVGLSCYLGHLFCHGCLMEALIAGEQQEQEQGKYYSRCPVCRKKVTRPKPGKDSQQVIPLEIQFTTRNQIATDKLKVSITS